MGRKEKLQPKYGTRFFERYAIVALRHFMGSRYDGLENYDRPDLQDDERSIGIEVTRAIFEDKQQARALVNEVAGEDIYTFGIDDGRMGCQEHDYWHLALPLRNILKSKLRKVQTGFYGDYSEFGLYVFTRSVLEDDDAFRTMEYLAALQDASPELRGYDNLYLSATDCLYEIDMHIRTARLHEIPLELRRAFFEVSMNGEKGMCRMK